MLLSDVALAIGCLQPIEQGTSLSAIETDVISIVGCAGAVFVGRGARVSRNVLKVVNVWVMSAQRAAKSIG